MKKHHIWAIPVLATLFLTTACSPSVTPETPTAAPIVTSQPTTAKATPMPPQSSTAPAKPITAGTALAVMNTLPVQAEDTAKYNRELFGPAWQDVDNNSCDTRNDMLQRDLTNPVLDTDKCTVLTGTMVDPYTGNTINFDRSKGGGGGIDIDHLIALSAAFKSGASTWSPDKRLQFANDPLNLLSSGSTPNRAKGDKDASEWLPGTAGNPSFNCQYVARQVAVKAKYGAWLLPAEKAAMEKTLGTCPNEPLPKDSAVVKIKAEESSDTPVAPEPKPVAPKPAPVPEPVPAPVQKPVPAPVVDSGSTPVDYGSCAKAKAAGAGGPFVQGTDPEYDFYKDTDKDGIVCE